MNKSSYTISIITSLLDDVESRSDVQPIELLGLLDELRRLERKWREQVAAGSTRRIDADFKTLGGWYRRWILAAKRISAASSDQLLAVAIEEVSRHLKEM